MKEELISFKTAKLAKEKGFDIDTTQRYVFRYAEHESKYYVGRLTDNPLQCDILAPTQSLLQRWLREVHNINVYCLPCEHDESLWYNNIASQIPVFTGTYEEALEIGLFEGLKLIK